MVHLKQITSSNGFDGYIITYDSGNFSTFKYVNLSEATGTLTCNFGDDANNTNIILTSNSSCAIKTEDQTSQNGVDLILKGGDSSSGFGANVVIATGSGSDAGHTEDGYIIFRAGASDDLAYLYQDNNGIFFVPEIDSTGFIGSAFYRWSKIYADNVISNDFCFTDDICVVCNELLKVDDTLVFKLYKQEEENGIIINKTVPIHLECAGK